MEKINFQLGNFFVFSFVSTSSLPLPASLPPPASITRARLARLKSPGRRVYAVYSVKYDIACTCMISCVYCIVTYVRDPDRFRGSHYLSFYSTLLQLACCACEHTARRFLFRQPIKRRVEVPCSDVAAASKSLFRMLIQLFIFWN